ncbi:hypothetical protein LIER_08069 [Lithospermum erythrorhizon]|uniref:Uncharacterized protein n=1 Tax=Lithospermum erythrorhizon TaxID=34254 RepID=A0AAV3PCC0_LITER
MMKVPDNNPFRKGKHCTIHVDFTSEVATAVTEVGEKNSTNEPIPLKKLLFSSKCEVMEVDEKLIKTEPGDNPFTKRNLGKSGHGKRRKTERKTTKCNSNESKTNSSSILNFFSRI